VCVCVCVLERECQRIYVTCVRFCVRMLWGEREEKTLFFMMVV
jgi:hypothetical protein